MKSSVYLYANCYKNTPKIFTQSHKVSKIFLPKEKKKQRWKTFERMSIVLSVSSLALRNNKIPTEKTLVTLISGVVTATQGWFKQLNEGPFSQGKPPWCVM